MTRIRDNRRAAAFALAGLILFAPSILLPIIRVERFGNEHETSILEGIKLLFEGEHYLIGVIVLCCSVIFPVIKLTGLLALLWVERMHHHHRAFTYRLIEASGRWGFLDVLLVCILVAIVKIRDYANVHMGIAVLLFTLCVASSLIATLSFEHHQKKGCES